MKHIARAFLACVFFATIIGCEEQAENREDLSKSYSTAWILEDSLTLSSSAQDTIYDGWPYFIDRHFYLLSFSSYQAFRFDHSGNIQSTVGKGKGKGPGENLYIQAITEVDSLVGFFDNWQQSIRLYDQTGEPQGSLKLDYEKADNIFYIDADYRAFNYYRGKFYNYIGYGEVHHGDPTYYDFPILGIHDLNGKLLTLSGERDAAYHEHHIPYAHSVYVAIDSFSERILVSQKASDSWETYDLEGNFLARYGQKGSNIADQTWPDVGFYGQASNATQRKQMVEKIFSTPQYNFLCAIGPDYVIRSYRRGVEDYEGMFNFLDKPHYLQIYDRNGRLLADEPAPDLHFTPVAYKDGLLWVSLARSYDVDAYSYTLYGYRLAVETKGGSRG